MLRRYLVRRLLVAVPSLLIATAIVFTLPRLIPGDAVQLMLAETSYAKDIDELRAKLGLDRPFHVQYVEWIGRAARGDLGESLWTRRPVVQELGQRLPVTAELALYATLIALLIAVPVGVLAAARQDSLSDYVVRSLAILGLSVPGFWLATLLIVLPAIWWGWRGMLLEVLRQDYVRTAWAKGLAERAVVIKHGLRNAVIPVITLLGTQLPQILGGTVVIETIFGLPGVSRFLFDAINQRDYPVIQGVNLLVVSTVVLVNLAVDALYAVLDPRIRY